METKMLLNFHLILYTTNIIAFLILSSTPSGVGLYCYKCLALECPGEQNECNSAREFLVNHIRSYYHVDTLLPSCPSIDDSVEWSLRHFHESPCPEQRGSNTATCTAGRIQIITTREDKSSIRSHATVLGCANTLLLLKIKDAKIGNRCYISQKNETNEGLYHKLEMEHCSNIENVCIHEDFCVNHEQSVVKEFKKDGQSIARFEYGLIIGIIIFIIVIFAAIIGANFCSFPLNRPSGIAKSTEDSNVVIMKSRSSTTEYRNNIAQLKEEDSEPLEI